MLPKKKWYFICLIGTVKKHIKDTEEKLTNDQVIDKYLEHFEISPVPGSKLVNINAIGTSPEWVATVANAHAEIYIQWSKRLKSMVSRVALDWLKTQL